MTPHFIAGLVLTGLVGASLGVLGAGGSIIMLPVLVYVIGVEPHTAVPLSLAIVGATSLLSAAARSGDGEIQWRAALHFGSAALVGAALGTRLTYLVPGSILLLSFGLLLVVVGVRMWRGSSARETHTIRPARPALMLSAGGVIGTLTGFLGVGGGFLIVPSLMAVGGLGIRMAVSTSLVVIAMSSAAGLVAHLAHGAPVSAPLALSLILAAALGMMAGMRGARRVSSRQLQRAFALFVMAVGAVLILINTPAALRLLASSAG